MSVEYFGGYIDGNGVYRGPEIWSSPLFLSRGKTLRSLGTLRVLKASTQFSRLEMFEDLGDLEEVHGDLLIDRCLGLKDLGKLKYVSLGDEPIGVDSGIKGGTLNLRGCSNLESLGTLESVGGSLFINNTKIIDLSNLTFLGDVLYASIGFIPPRGLNCDICISSRLLKDLTTTYFYFNTVESYLDSLARINKASLLKLVPMKLEFDDVFHPFIDKRLRGESIRDGGTNERS